MYLQKGTKWNKTITKIGQYRTKISHFKLSKMPKKQRYGVATAQSVYEAAYEWYKFPFHSESGMSFSIRYICWLFHFHILGQNCPCRLYLSMQIQIMMFVTKSAIFDKPTPKMLLWSYLTELINEKVIIKFLDVHTINIYGKPHGIGILTVLYARPALWSVVSSHLRVINIDFN